jgi:hypothetical protein
MQTALISGGLDDVRTFELAERPKDDTGDLALAINACT